MTFFARHLPHFGISTWLAPWEQDEVIEAMLHYGILMWDNNRNLPLKSGGTTDVYVNLRNARNNYDSMKYFASKFQNPMVRLDPDRIAEVPQAVSCLAGPLAIAMKRPLVTIRETPKEGRVSDATIIGEINYGDLVALFDDVITDGASKMSGIHAIEQRGGKPVLVVLVDRQQGWEERMGSTRVWSGLTLHNIRAHLVRNRIMERCDPAREADNPIIIGLDGMGWDEMLPYLDQFRTTGAIFKVGDSAINMGIQNLVPEVQVYGRVMVDTKIHDTPKTAANIAQHICHYFPWAMTAHASGGPEMVRAIVSTLRSQANFKTIVLAVTVLTSIEKETGKRIFNRLPLSEVKVLARLAYDAGARGFVCSPKETKVLKKMFPDCIIVNPGVRSPDIKANDQKRVATPREALDWGASHIVMASQLFNANSPVEEFNRVCSEELGITS